jgi:hypothetical protein
MSPFKWTPKRSDAAVLLAEGYTVDETAKEVEVSDRTIARWKTDLDFAAEVDRLSLMVGIANRAERLRLAKKIIRRLVEKQIPTQKDLLEWLKYAQGETDGVKLDLTALYEDAPSLAGSGQDGAEGNQESAEA